MRMFRPILQYAKQRQLRNSIHTGYLEKLVGAEHPMLEIAKKSTYLSEGRLGSAKARASTVTLIAKATQSLSIGLEELVSKQNSLAEMTGMIYSAYMIHRGIIDMKRFNLESGKEKATSEKNLHYTNHVAILTGDFLFAYVIKGLSDLYSCKTVGLMASSVRDLNTGQFLLFQDWENRNYLDSPESRNLDRWERRSYLTNGSLQGNACQSALVLANIDDRLQEAAREFGRYLGFAWSANTELQPFLNQNYEEKPLPELAPYPAFDLNFLPVLLFLQDSYKTSKLHRILNQVRIHNEDQLSWRNQLRHCESVDYKELHRLIRNQGKAIEDTLNRIKFYSQQAIGHLESFPPCEARDALRDTCESLYKR